MRFASSTPEPSTDRWSARSSYWRRRSRCSASSRPIAVRLQLTSVADAGQTAGSLYALSTVGSIAGSFVPVLLLIPLVGTAATFVALALALIIPALAGLIALRARRMAGVAVLVALMLPALALAAPGGIRPPDHGVLIHEQESAYNYIQVVEENGQRALILNDGHAVHSLYDPQHVLNRRSLGLFHGRPVAR